MATENLESRQLLTNFTVTTAVDETTNDALVSLREAVNLANLNSGADTITFDSSLAGQRFLLEQGQLLIVDPLTISGLGATDTVIDGQQSFRVFELSNTAGDVTLDGLTITAGLTNANDAPGAGVYSRSLGKLTITNSAITACETSGVNSKGAAIFSAVGTVTVLDSTISGNSTLGTFSPGGGIATHAGSIRVINSTISGNVTRGSSSGGGGIATYSGDITLTNATLTVNATTGASSPGGAVFSGGTGATEFSTVRINNSILADNTAVQSTAADFFKNAGVSNFFVNSSLIGVDSGTGLSPAPIGSPDSNGNLIGTTTVPIDPQLGNLADNGGTTQTHRLLTNSPAINAGNNSLAVTPENVPLEFDQAGQVRIFNSIVDMGSYELPSSGTTLPTVSFSTSTQSAGEGSGVVTITVMLSATTSQAVTVPFTINGSATNSTDYTISNSPLVIPANTASGTIQITIVDDATVEGNETVGVTLGNPTNATLGNTIVDTLTIVDDDSVSGAPTNITLSANSVSENVANSVVGTLTATDPNASDTHTFTIRTGGQGSQFTIVGNQLRVGATGLDYESLAGGVAQATVRATDNTGLFFDKVFSIVVEDLNESATIPAGQVFSVTENSANGTNVGTVSATDPDSTAPNNTLTYSLIGGNTNNAFGINASTGLMTVTNQSAITSTSSPFTLQIRVTDGGSPSLSATQNVTVNVGGANSTPVIASGQVFTTAENRPVGAVVATVIATDPDPTAPNGTLTYSISGGNTGNAFAINSTTGQLSILTPSAVNFELDQQFSLQITVADGGSPSLSATETVTINVSDANDAPSIPTGQSFSINEHAPNAMVVGTVVAVDPDSEAPNNLLTYSIIGGNPGNAFSINATSGQISVANSAVLDFAATPVFALQVRVTDAGAPNLSSTQTVLVNLNDVNDPPSIPLGQTFTISDGAAVNSLVGQVLASDPDSNSPNNTLTYSIVGGNSAGVFAISSNGLISVSNPSSLNSALTPQYVLQIRVADGGSPSLSTTQNVTVNVTEANHAPSIPAGQSFSINENAPVNSVVGTVLASDSDSTSPNNTLTYSIDGGNTNNGFSINAVTGQITVSNSDALDFESSPTFSLLVRVRDGGTPSLSSTQTVSVTLVDGNDAPVVPAGQILSVNENSPVNTVVGNVLATDPDSSGPNSLMYSISSGNTNNAFAINPTTGQVTVNNPSALTFANGSFYSLNVTVTDSGVPALSSTQSVRVNLVDVNNSPTIPVGQVFTINENSPVNSVVGTVVAMDPDATAPNQTLTYSVLAGNLNNAFTINPSTGQITVSNPLALNFEAIPQYSLQVQVADGGTPALTATTNVVVNVSDRNEPPTVGSGQAFSIPENVANSTSVGIVVATDQDTSAPNNTLVYSISGGNVNNAFAIDPATGLITVSNANALNFEANPQYTLQVNVSDGGNPALFTIQSVQITVNDVNEAPAIATNQTFTIAEHLPVNTVVGTVIATDPDTIAPNSTLAYSLVGGNTSNAFVINPLNGVITVNNTAALDVTLNPTFSLQVTVTDGGGLSATQTVTVNLTDVNEPPVLSNSGEPPVYTHRNGSVTILPNLTVSDATSSTDLAQVIITLPIPGGRRNPDIVGIIGGSALGTVSDTTDGNRRQIRIQLNDGVTTNEVQTFLQQVTFSTKGRGLRLTHRDFQVRVVDRQGASSNVITQDIVVRRRAPR